MWCQRCQQDVPAVASPASRAVVCARCQFELSPHTSGIDDHGIALDAAPSREPDAVEKLSDWQAEQRFRHLARTLRAGTAVSKSTAGFRVDPPNNMFSQSVSQSEQLATNAPVVATPRVMPTLAARQTNSGGQLISWLAILFGTFIFGGGIGLGSWSIYEDIPLYWDIGVMLTLVGQGFLILGLVLVLSRLWRNSRYASGKLNEIQWQLGEVQRTAQAIVGLKNGSAPSFYAELARGASPQMLLSSLRGQLDQLAVRVGNE